jgi:MFS family permease
MGRTIRSFGALFAATFLFLTGNGLLNTLLSTRMAMDNFSVVTSGIVLSCYFVGLLAGSFFCGHLIERVGHIRAFTIFAAGTAASALLHALFLSALFWGLIRFLSGATTFGMFMVIESWLNECTEPGYRGRVFSIYMTISYLGIGVGQQLLTAGNVMGLEPFIIAGILFSICLVPVSTTEGIHPRLPERKRIRFINVFNKAPLGMLGSMTAGLTNGAFYSMMPVVCTAMGFSVQQLSWIMSITVFCGLGAQWIVGSLSDQFDRTVVLTGVAIAMAAVSGGMFLFEETAFVGLAVKMGVWGALMFAVYPVSVARAHDLFQGRDTVTVSSGLILAYSIGACASPLLASVAMTALKGPGGLFAFWCVTQILFVGAIYFFKAREKVALVPVEQQATFIPMKSTTQVAMAFDPRNEPHGNPTTSYAGDNLKETATLPGG